MYYLICDFFFFKGFFLLFFKITCQEGVLFSVVLSFTGSSVLDV